MKPINNVCFIVCRDVWPWQRVCVKVDLKSVFFAFSIKQTSIGWESRHEMKIIAHKFVSLLNAQIRFTRRSRLPHSSSACFSINPVWLRQRKEMHYTRFCFFINKMSLVLFDRTSIIDRHLSSRQLTSSGQSRSMICWAMIIRTASFFESDIGRGCGN